MESENGTEGILVEESKDFPIVSPESLTTVNPSDSDYNFDSVVKIVWAMTDYVKSNGLISAQVLDGTPAENIVCFRDFSINFDSLVTSLYNSFQKKEKLVSEKDSEDKLQEHLEFGVAYSDTIPTSEYLISHPGLVTEIFNMFMARKMANVSAKNDLAKNMWRFANIIYQTNFNEGDVVQFNDSVKDEIVKQYALGNWIGYSQNGWIKKSDCEIRADSCNLCRAAKKSMRAGELIIVPEVVPGYVAESGLAEFKGGITRKLTPEDALCSEEMDFQKSDLKSELKISEQKSSDMTRLTRILSSARYGLEYLELHKRYNLVNVGFKINDASHLTKYKVDFYE
jgi:hypothetical protein